MTTCALCGNPWSNCCANSQSVDKQLEQRDATITQLEAALREFVDSPAEFDDERISYVTLQVDRATLRDAHQLLDPTTTTKGNTK